MNLNTPTKAGLYWYFNDEGIWTIGLVENRSYYSPKRGWYKELELFRFGDEQARSIYDNKFGPEITRYTGEE